MPPKGALMNQRLLSHYLLLALLLLAVPLLPGAESLQAQEYLPVEKGVDPSFAEVVDDPELPRVLLIGDSISMGYTPPLRKLLQGKVNVHRIPENGHATVDGLKSLDKWLGDSKWDLIHFNFGLHDLKKLDANGKSVSSPELGEYYVPVEEYEKNLRVIAERLQKTGAKLVWRNTTPVPAGTRFRAAGDEIHYNEAAKRVMDDLKIPIDDHWKLVKKRPKLQRPRDVHFTREGSQALAEQVAKVILKELKSDSSASPE
jgi:acyl-CoA thioesterase-1